MYELLGDPAIRAEIKDWRPYIEKELSREPPRINTYNRMLDYHRLLGLTASDLGRMQRAWEIEKESKGRSSRHYFNEENAYYLLSKLQSSSASAI